MAYKLYYYNKMGIIKNVVKQNIVRGIDDNDNEQVLIHEIEPDIEINEGIEDDYIPESDYFQSMTYDEYMDIGNTVSRQLTDYLAERSDEMLVRGPTFSWTWPESNVAQSIGRITRYVNYGAEGIIGYDDQVDLSEYYSIYRPMRMTDYVMNAFIYCDNNDNNGDNDNKYLSDVYKERMMLDILNRERFFNRYIDRIMLEITNDQKLIMLKWIIILSKRFEYQSKVLKDRSTDDFSSLFT